MSTSEAIQMVNQRQAVWVDVRPAEQFQAGHIAQARSVPAADLEQKAGNLPKNKPLIVVCDNGRDSARAAAKLRAQGYADVVPLDGGMRAWLAAACRSRRSDSGAPPPPSATRFTIRRNAHEQSCHVQQGLLPLLRPRRRCWSSGVADLEIIQIDRDPAQRDIMIERTGRRTVPQIFIGDTHVGGCDDLMALDRAGGLAPLLNG